ncbi:C40 family peptidase [Burkholderia cepacia]|uniref:C40 family peptidase n=1 Tax=Burkholderia cepacia TaxID=292 RepID=UPI001F2D765D|nr:NlpC/P60 family protein [Burkholderia cepacia]MCE4125750.1 NlpC/P60 family protein [Burkholderia cepacia]
MVTRQQVVDEARTWAGTRWQHQGRLKGIGVDCAGLVVCALRNVGIEVDDVDGYPRRPDGSLLEVVRRQTEPTSDWRAGDVVLMHWDNDPCHLGILTSPSTIIHAYAMAREVVEHDLDDHMLSHITCVRQVRGVE